MKTKILIVEDNCYKLFTTKQVLESLLRLDVRMLGTQNGGEALKRAGEFNPDMVIYRPDGGVADLIAKMKKRNSNRRNTEVALLMTDETDPEICRKLCVTSLERSLLVSQQRKAA